jgi:diaminopimelate epimerase
MSIYFTKMHGLGNDFMVIDNIRQKINLEPINIARLSQRDTGVGFDQCLLIEKSDDPEIDFFYRIFNANGQEVGQCGNGARCLGRFVQRYGLTDKRVIQIATHATRMQLHIHSNESVTVDLEKPQFDPVDVPLLAETESVYYTIPFNDNTTCQVHAVNVGNPHAIIPVKNLQQINIHDLGKQISVHSFFPEQTNVGFMEIISPQQINLRVYERGCGETRACGSGAVAAVAIGRRYHQLAESVTVHLPGGQLIVNWPSMSDAISLTGPATFVYEGKLESINDWR